VPGGGWALGITQSLPAENTRFLNTETVWNAEFDEVVIDPDGFPNTVSFALDRGKTYRAGQTVTERFNRAVFGPSLSSPLFEGGWVSRKGDDILIAAPLYGDGDGRAGLATYDKARIALYRDGVLVGEEPFAGALFKVAPGNALYRAETSAERGAPYRLTTKVSVEWTFRSSHVDAATPLPVTTLSFAAPVDDRNVARAGAPVALPVSVVQQPGSGAQRLRSLTVEVSYDDGRSWREAPVLNLLGHYLVLLRHPEAAGFVSLRAKAEDRAGNTVTQTVVRAYEIK
jgi:hypothetical protein